MALSFEWKRATANVAALEQKVQQLEQNLTQQTQLIQQLNNQIQNLTTQLNNTAKTNQRNKFQEIQEIQYPGEALSFIQDNNANYIHFKRSDGIRRGYLGIGSGNSKVMDVNGAEGVKITATSGDINLITQNSINANNKPIKNIANPTTDNDAINWNYLNTRIKTVEGDWRTTTGQLNWPNLQGGILKVLNLETWFANGPDKRPALASKFEITNNGQDFSFNIETYPSVPPVGNNFRAHARLTYISLR